MTQSSRYAYGIDLIRFASAMMVAMFHITCSAWANPDGAAKNIIHPGYSFPYLQHFTWFGWVGVEIFFVISGFVIANSANGSSAVGFLKSRAARLYPATWLCATTTLIVAYSANLYTNKELTIRYLHSVTLFPIHPWMDAVYWTLAVEIVFYMLIFLLLAKNRFKWIKTFSLVLALITVIYQCPLLLSKIGVLPELPLIGLQVTRLLMLDYGSFFSLGIFIWLSNTKHKDYKTHALAAVSTLGCILELVNHTLYVGESVPIANGGLIKTILPPLLTWMLAVLLIFYASRKTVPLAPGLETTPRKVIRKMGLMTFPVYLIHFTFGIFTVDRLHVLGLPLQSALIISLMLILFFSYLVATYGEPPLKRFIFRTFDRAFPVSKLKSSNSHSIYSPTQKV